MLRIFLFIFAIYSANANIAEKLVEKSNEVRGGEEGLKNIKNWDILATSINPNSGQSDDFILKFEGETSFYVEQEVQGNRNVFVSNGKEAWYLAPMMQVTEFTPLEDPILSKVKSDFAQQIKVLKGILVGLKDQGLEVSFLGKEEFNSEKVNKISIKNPQVPDSLNNQKISVYIGASDNLVKKVNIATQQASFDIVFSEYKKVGNFLFPHLVVQQMNGTPMAKMQVKKIEVNPKFEPGTFSKPSK